MAIHLPRPNEIYFESDKARDAVASPRALPRTRRSTMKAPPHEGLAAIKAWKSEARRKYEYTIEPLEPAQRDGKTVVAARVAGNFPGSPVTLAFIFVLERDRIASLEIRS
jgi:hypothetical protein